MATAAKVNGLTTAGSFFGYTPKFLKISGTNVATADTASVDGVAAFTEGNLAKAVRALQTRASIVHIGERADDLVVIAVDAATNADTDQVLENLIDAAVGGDGTGSVATVATITLASGDLA